jgi:hypothetical protein
MGKLTDTDITGLLKQKSYAPLGQAHELLVRAIFMRLGLEVGKVDLESGPYDLIVRIKNTSNDAYFLRVQVKTIKGSLPLTAGSRGGVDREYKSSEKQYKYNKNHNDIIIGVDRENFDFYVFPTMFAELYGSSVSKKKIQVLKNNWDIFTKWGEGIVQSLFRELKRANA